VLQIILNKFKKQKDYTPFLEWVNRYNRENIYPLEHLPIIGHLHIGGDFKLDFVSEEIGKLKKLKYLNLYTSKLKKLPDSLDKTQLTNEKTLFDINSINGEMMP